MGTKVEADSYLPRYCSMRDLNHDSDSTSWASFYGENCLSNGHYYYNPFLRAPSDSSPGANKDILKQTILKHESIFKDQVIELHRLYRVQKNLMDDILRQEQYKNRIMYEASSSSSILPSQITPDDAHGRNSSRSLFTNSVCDGPPVSVQAIIQCSAGSNYKGKSIQGSSITPQKHGSLKESESRPIKLRKMIDLELPAEEYIDVDEVEQQGNRATLDSEEKLFPSCNGNTMYQKDASRSESSSRKPNVLADLNEPVQSEETSVNPSVNFLGVPIQDLGVSKDLPWNSKRGNMNATLDNSYIGNHWLSSVLKEDGNKESGRSIHHINHPGKASVSSSPVKSSHQPAGIFHIHSTAKSNIGFKTFDRTQSFSSYSNGEVVLPSQLPSHVPSSYLGNSWDPSYGRPNSCVSQKSSSVQASPHLNSTSLSKSPQSSVRSNEFLGNGSSSGLKELPAHFSKAALDYVNSSYNDKANSIDLNSAEDFNLNVALPNLDGEVKDPLSVLPWLRPKTGTSNYDAAKMLDHHNSAVSSSDVDRPSSCKKIIDINLPCDESEDFDNSTTMSENIVVEEKTEIGHSSGLPNIIDLNSCVMEDEIPTIELEMEAPIDLETEEEGSDQDRATAAAEAIIAISLYTAKNDVSDTLITPPDDALAWFVDIVCSSPNDAESSRDYFEEMTLKLTECTVEEYFPSPPVFDIQTVEDETGPTNVSGRTRRGPVRRGRQRRDFQRDILPGLVSLARNEVTEDIQTFGGLMRATGHTWPCGTRRNGSRNGSGRGRRRRLTVPPPPPPPPPPPLESTSLTSWGKTTRRPRRQRCSTAVASNLAPIALS